VKTKNTEQKQLSHGKIKLAATPTAKQNKLTGK
jgi:hypothetical protein